MFYITYAYLNNKTSDLKGEIKENCMLKICSKKQYREIIIVTIKLIENNLEYKRVVAYTKYMTQDVEIKYIFI